MAIDKPSLNDFLPNGFETQDKDGYKVNFDADKISAGYDKDTLEILSGPNLNNLLDNVGKNTHVLEQFLTFFRDMPIGSFPITNASNQLDYKSVNSFFRNVGELVFSAIPLEDGNLRLLDGSLLEYTMTYSRFITYIAGLRASLPNLFCTQAQFDQSVATYGVCGKFVYDTVTKSLRLPKISGFIKGTLDSGSLGDVDEAKAPNITGEFCADNTQVGNSQEGGSHAPRGAFYKKATISNFDLKSDSSSQNGGTMGFDASRSSSVYKDGVTTIEPQSIKEFIYMVVSIDEAEKQVLSAVYNYKGSVPTYADLPTAVAIGEVYNVIGEDPEGYSGANFAWTGEEWDRLGGTVNLSGYLPRTEAANTYATKASLESNVDNLQEQINTNASNISNIASQEVIDQGIRKIEMLKFASTLGIGKVADTDLFNQILDMKYSNFNINNFTKVGSSVVVTKDGILSDTVKGANTSGNSYLKNNTFDWSILNGRPIKIKFQFTTKTNKECFILSLGANSNAGLGIWYQGLNNFGVIFTHGDNNTLYDVKDIRLSANTSYYGYFQLTGQKLIIALGTTPNNITIRKNVDFTDYLKNCTALSVGCKYIRVYNDIYSPHDGTMDLKYLSVEVDDGVEVFSGCKQGMDILKPTNFNAKTTMYAYKYSTYTIYADSDTAPTELYNEDGTLYTGSDWTISGTDVKYGANTATYTSGSNKTTIPNPGLPCVAGIKITEDGIASNFTNNGTPNNGNYLNLPVDLFRPGSKPWKIEITAIFGDTLVDQTILALNQISNTIYGCLIKANVDGSASFQIYETTEGGNITIGSTASNLIQPNGTHTFAIEFTGSIYNCYIDDSLVKNVSSTAIVYQSNTNTSVIGTRLGIDQHFTGKIDLNSFKIYIGGELTYQSMLRIPYNLSKTGLKVTDKLDRAIDVAEQCGFSQYYGIDKDNMLCLVPQGENITGRRDLVSQEEDANHNVIEYYSDFYCKQSGSCTSGTAITFAQPYKDDNAYKLNVPYSAKSKTGFTPSASGDYTAEGHIYLT